MLTDFAIDLAATTTVIVVCVVARPYIERGVTCLVGRLDIYKTGYAAGYGQGYAEGRRVARPVVVPAIACP